MAEYSDTGQSQTTEGGEQGGAEIGAAAYTYLPGTLWDNEIEGIIGNNPYPFNTAFPLLSDPKSIKAKKSPITEVTQLKLNKKIKHAAARNLNSNSKGKSISQLLTTKPATPRKINA